MGSRATADAGAVLIEGHVADIVEAVFNAPMATARIEQALRISTLGFETGNPIDGFGGEFVADQVRRFTANGANLFGVGEVDISIQVRAGPYVADLQPSISFIDRRVLRGEKTPVSDRRYPDAGWADSL